MESLVKYKLRFYSGAISWVPPEERQKRQQQQTKKKGRAGVQATERKAPQATLDDTFGDLDRIQSQYKTTRNFSAISAIDASMAGQQVWVRARAHNVRHKGNSCFVVLRHDLFTIQAGLFKSDSTPKEMVVYAGKIPAESIVDVLGLVKTVDQPITGCTQQDVELEVIKIFAVSVSQALPFQLEDAARPLTQEEDARERSFNQEAANAQADEQNDETDEKRQLVAVNQDTRLNNRWVDLRTPANHCIFRVQSMVCQFFRSYLLSQNFIEIHTPKLIPGSSEGGANVFKFDYFGNEACLAQSPQLYKQMAINSDLSRVFEIGPVFRAEDANTNRHLCEFTGLDLEMAIKEHYHEVLKVLDHLFVFIFDNLNLHCARELETIAQQYPFEPLQYRRPTLILHFPDAVKMLREAGYEQEDLKDLSTPNEKALGRLVKEKYQTDFYILDKYPLSARPFYTMPCPENPDYSNSYDIFIRGEEITSGAQRVHDPVLLEERAKACDIPLSTLKPYVDSFRYGAFPHGGAGIGLERVVMLFCGLNNIRKTVMYPRDPRRCAP